MPQRCEVWAPNCEWKEFVNHMFSYWKVWRCHLFLKVIVTTDSTFQRVYTNHKHLYWRTSGKGNRAKPVKYGSYFNPLFHMTKWEFSNFPHSIPFIVGVMIYSMLVVYVLGVSIWKHDIWRNNTTNHVFRKRGWRFSKVFSNGGGIWLMIERYLVQTLHAVALRIPGSDRLNTLPEARPSHFCICNMTDKTSLFL